MTISTTVPNQDCNGFEGTYQGSNKTPDRAVQIKKVAWELEAKFVLEVSFLICTRTCFRMPNCGWRANVKSLVVVVKFEESPSYQSLATSSNLDNEDIELPEFLKVSEIRIREFSLEESTALSSTLDG